MRIARAGPRACLSSFLPRQMRYSKHSEILAKGALKDEKIGFIGVGVMGKSMVRNLMKHGFEVSIYARTKAKV